MIEKIRKKINREEFDYLMLLDCLKEYSRPRDKITDARTALVLGLA